MYLNIGEYRTDRNKRNSISSNTMHQLGQNGTIKVPKNVQTLRTWLAFNEDNFIYSCIMAGCDYLPSLKGMGLIKAVDYLERMGDLDRAVNKLCYDKAFRGKVPDNYADTVKRTKLIFLHQRIYNPKGHCFATVRPLPQPFSAEDEIFIGEEFVGIDDFISGDIDIKFLKKREHQVYDLQALFRNDNVNTGKMNRYYIEEQGGTSNKKKNQDVNQKQYQKQNQSKAIMRTNIENFPYSSESENENGPENNESAMQEQIDTDKQNEQKGQQIAQGEGLDYLFHFCEVLRKEMDAKKARWSNSSSNSKINSLQQMAQLNQRTDTKNIQQIQQQKNNDFESIKILDTSSARYGHNQQIVQKQQTCEQQIKQNDFAKMQKNLISNPFAVQVPEKSSIGKIQLVDSFQKIAFNEKINHEEKINKQKLNQQQQQHQKQQPILFINERNKIQVNLVKAAGTKENPLDKYCRAKEVSPNKECIQNEFESSTKAEQKKKVHNKIRLKIDMDEEDAIQEAKNETIFNKENQDKNQQQFGDKYQIGIENDMMMTSQQKVIGKIKNNANKQANVKKLKLDKAALSHEFNSELNNFINQNQK